MVFRVRVKVLLIGSSNIEGPIIVGAHGEKIRLKFSYCNVTSDNHFDTLLKFLK